MKVEKNEIVNSKKKTTVILNGERYSRLECNPVEWRKCKSNHILNKIKSTKMEDKFNSISLLERAKPIERKLSAIVSNSNVKLVNIIGYKTQADLNKAVMVHVDDNKLLAAVKLFKDASGLGLKESKDYVEDLRDKIRLKK